MANSLIEDLSARGCIADCTNREELTALLASQSITFYCGFDPTADSLHVGNMIPLTLMRRLQQAGHRPIVLVGSGTGMIGDPSGRSDERKLLSEETVLNNVAAIEAQCRRFFSFEGKNSCVVVHNASWLGKLDLLSFLRDVGKHFSVNAMIAKESVRARLENREQGISYTEFTYMILQAYDFWWLNQNYGCRLQVGGADQWGNITAGVDLIRRKGASESSYGLTFPLLTNSAGTKFGKSEGGNIWLDASKTSPYKFYQFWLNQADADVIKLLKLFTELTLTEVTALEEELRTAPEKRIAQKRLAEEITRSIHGESELAKAKKASEIFFGGSIEGIDSATLAEIFADVPSSLIERAKFSEGIAISDLLTTAGVAESKSAARRLIESGGIYVNNNRATDASIRLNSDSLIDGSMMVIRSGKRNYYLVRTSE